MRLMFLTSVLIALITPILKAQTTTDIISYAEELLEKGNYEEAITEYKRFLFFNPEDARVDLAMYNMGLAYRATQNWQNAIDAIEASISSAKDTVISRERRLKLATTLIASGNYSLARLELIRLTEFDCSPQLRMKALYFSGVNSVYMFDWNSAVKAFDEFYSEHADTQALDRATEVRFILQNADKSYKSVGVAKFLSAVFPGAGQIYAGEWRDGINALVLNGLLIGFTARMIAQNKYKDAALLSFVALRYYMGNIYHAETDVMKHNRSLDRRNIERVLKIISTDEPS